MTKSCSTIFDEDYSHYHCEYLYLAMYFSMTMAYGTNLRHFRVFYVVVWKGNFGTDYYRDDDLHLL